MTTLNKNKKSGNADKVLFILEKGPEAISAEHIKTLMGEYLTTGNSITLFIHKSGVKWLLDSYWDNIYPGCESIVYYADAGAMHYYDIPLQDDVIISNPKIIQQLLSWSDKVHFLS